VCESGICNSGICAPKPDVCLEPGADADGDGYKATLYKGKSCGPDCDDNNALVHPGAVDVCCNGVDEDCSGGDAVCPKVCGNGIDENCNGKVD
ncbi:putative metal-binding motif-containing protein, partial [Candidatus Woesearchaeota archaeon]|nr:putative metal-binding motif-containing protein [Candidatus Woesearchaeota archaeon]